MSEWQSIETAPAYSKPVLLWHPLWFSPQAGKHLSDGHVLLMTGPYTATHWMPLPEPPTT